MLKKLHLKLVLLLTAMVMGVGNVWGTDITISFGTGTGCWAAHTDESFTDSDSRTWTRSYSAGGKSSGQSGFSQFGNSSNTCTSLELKATAGSDITVTAFSVKMSGASTTTAGTIYLYKESSGGSKTQLATASVSGTTATECKITSSQVFSSTDILSVSYVGTAKAIRVNELSYSYTNSSSGSNPSVEVASKNVNATAAETKGTINVTYKNITNVVADVAFYEANGTTSAEYDWISAEVNPSTNNLDYVIKANTGAERTAYLKVYALDDEGNDVYSDLITVTQAAAPVAAPATPTVSLDFTNNTDWEFPEGSSNGATDAADFTDGNGYTITLAAPTKYYFNTDGYLMLGKNGATLTLPAFPFNVKKIEVVGRSAASPAVLMNIYVGEDAVSTETTGATGTNTYAIADNQQAAGTVYTLKVNSSHNTQITAIKIYGYENVAVTAAGYATLCAPADLDFTGLDVKAYKALETNDGVDFELVTEVPAGAGVLLKAKQGKQSEYEVPVIATASALDGNVFVGVANAGETIDGNNGNFYVLRNAPDGLGFYKVTASPYHLKQGTAYLSLNKALAKNFIDIDNTTSIGLIGASKNDAQMFNLAGQRVGNDYKGIVIVNGKKVIR